MNLSNVVILPYKMGSNSAKNLSKELSNNLKKRVRQLYTDDRSKFVPKNNSVLLNWGNSRANQDYSRTRRVINPFERVSEAGNKLSTFNILLQHNNLVTADENTQSVSIPDFTTDPVLARDWVRAGIVVVCRNQLTGHSGAGISIAAREEDVPDSCPLFVKYVKKKKEFRVHVAFGQVIDVQQKRRRADYTEQPNFAIRNYHTGWVYCREDIEEPPQLRQQALLAVQTLRLDFGAVDVIWNERQNTCTVLEVNTAPGLEGTTVQNYAHSFANYLMENHLAT